VVLLFLLEREKMQETLPVCTHTRSTSDSQLWPIPWFGSTRWLYPRVLSVLIDTWTAKIPRSITNLSLASRPAPAPRWFDACLVARVCFVN